MRERFVLKMSLCIPVCLPTEEERIQYMLNLSMFGVSHLESSEEKVDGG